MTVPWRRIHKGDTRARVLADRHYTRQTPGHPMWTRPGYNFVLLATYPAGSALFCWWRPKWEHGGGAVRKDGLRVIECTMFRREGVTDLASDLIRAAVDHLSGPDAKRDLHLHNAGRVTSLLTGVSSGKTSSRRSKRSLPGECFRRAGWYQSQKRPGRADVWLCLPWENPWAA